MINPEFGKPYPYIPAIKEFYRTLVLREEYADLYMASDTFIEATGFIHSPKEKQAFIKSIVTPGNEKIAGDMQFMRDTFVTLPLELLEQVGQYDDRLSRLPDLARWYGEVTEFILDIADEHSLSCLATGNNPNCRYGGFCPVKQVASTLKRGVLDGPSRDLSYGMYDHPHKRREVVMRKFEIAYRNELVEPEKYKDLLADYDYAYVDVFPDTTFQA